MNLNNLKEFSHIFREEDKFFLTSHTNPDGDALGSLLGLYHFLKGAGKEVTMMVPNHFPDFLDWMPGSDRILIFKTDAEACKKAFQESRVLVSLDYNAPSRIGPAEPLFRSSPAKKLLIDHHIDPETEAYDYLYSTTEVSSTAQLVYRILRATDRDLITREVNDSIYAGILTDTGSFSFNCNYPEMWEMVSEMVRLGTATDEISRNIYAGTPENRLRLLGYALSEKLVVKPELKAAWIWLTREELNRFGYRPGDTEGLVNYALSVKGVRLAALFTERDNKIRISFRSVGNFSVNDLARNHFAGGGHRNAAGGDSFRNMQETLEFFEQIVRSYVDQI